MTSHTCAHWSLRWRLKFFLRERRIRLAYLACALRTILTVRNDPLNQLLIDMRILLAVLAVCGSVVGFIIGWKLYQVTH